MIRRWRVRARLGRRPALGGGWLWGVAGACGRTATLRTLQPADPGEEVFAVGQWVYCLWWVVARPRVSLPFLDQRKEVVLISSDSSCGTLEVTGR